MKKQNLDFVVARNFFIEMTYYIIQDYLEKNVGMFNFAILDIDLAITIMKFLKKDKLVLLLVNMRYLYEYLDSNSWSKFIYISTYKITEGHSVIVRQTKNRLEVVGFDHLSLGERFENFSLCIFLPWSKHEDTSLNEEWLHI